MKTIQAILDEARGGTLDNPVELSEYIVRLAYESGEIERQIVETEILTAALWRELRPNCKTDKDADMAVKLQPQWATWQKLRAYGKQVDRIRSAFNKRLRTLGDEFRNQ